MAVSLLFFRVFRERCLLVWGAGWVAYGAFLWMTGTGESHVTLKTSTTAAAFAETALRWRWDCLSAAAPDGSAQARRTLTALLAVSWVLMVCAAMRPFYFPDSKTLGLGVEVACRLIAAASAVELLRYRFGVLGWGLSFSALGW